MNNVWINRPVKLDSMTGPRANDNAILNMGELPEWSELNRSTSREFIRSEAQETRDYFKNRLLKIS
jgi:hypothetical protein